MITYIRTFGTSGKTLYLELWNSDNKIANQSAFETYDPDHWSTYVYALTEKESSGNYYVPVPSWMTAGTYLILVYEQQGANPTVTDPRFDRGEIVYNGYSETVEVIEFDASIAIVTPTKLKAWLKISGTSEDTILAAICNRANKYAVNYMGRNPVSTTYTEYYDGNGSGILLLNNYPIINLTSLNDDSNRDFGSATAIDVAADVLLYEDSGMVRLWNKKVAFYKGLANVKVVYVAGYAVIPYDMEEAVLLIAMQTYKRIYQDQRIGLTSESLGEHTMSYSDDEMPKRSKMILNAYRKISLPGLAT